jgi:hypothetical protein
MAIAELFGTVANLGEREQPLPYLICQSAKIAITAEVITTG